MRGELIELLYDNNVRCDIGVESLAEDIGEVCTPSWTSVEDKLPEATYDCLVWYSCDTAFGKCKSWGIAHCSRGDWYTKHLDGDNIEVLYWMPMPEPPKEEENEQFNQ